MAVVVLNENFEKSSETLELPESFKGINPHNLYLYVKAFQAGLRANTARVKTRTQVSGGGKKPWSQKGRGGARAGSKRSPIFVGGGVAFGPTDRNYTQKVNKKQKRLALKFAINELAENNQLFVVDSVKVESGKTKDANKMFANLGAKRALVVTNESEEKATLAFRNLPKCELVESNALNGFTASKFQAVVLERSVWENLTKEG
jgi:large subunit ribosomal protein L4